MRQRRRIFRPSAQPRRWPNPALLLGAGALGWLVIGLGLPADLFGSAPREREWTVLATDVRVVDGDTLRLGDRTLRLSGIEAPARGLRCTDGEGRGFDCGAAAAEALARLVAGRDLVCRVHGRDRFGRALGACSAGTTDVNASLVDGGWARAADATGGLAVAEAAARAGRRGLWAGGFPATE
ncbi:MAG: thermonuclease family protein [Acetobacteraceae bacterium]